MYEASYDNCDNYTTMEKIIENEGLDAYDVLRYLTDWHGLQLLDKAFMDNLINCELQKGDDFMQYREAVKIFKESYRDLYDEQVDYWTAQECWANFTDILCKDGTITEKQWNNWETPFPYGKHLKPIRAQFVPP